MINRLTLVLVLFAIALSSTIIALGFQRYFGRLPLLTLLGQIIAALGAVAFAFKLRGRH